MHNNIKYSHIINPFTGFPAQNKLLSVSVLSADCIDADAYATAFMSMGLEKTKEFLLRNPDIRVYLIYTDSNPLENDFDQAAKLGIYLSKNTSFEVYLSTDKNSKLENYSDSVIHKGEVNGIKSKKDLENLINSIENMEMEAVA